MTDTTIHETQDLDELQALIEEARQRRGRRRWWFSAVALIVVLSVAIAMVVNGGSRKPPVARPRAGLRPSPATTPPGSATVRALAAGHWSMLAPRPGNETAWDLAAWTGTYVVAWGSTQPCCTATAGNTSGGSSEDGAAFDPTSRTWRRLPSAPVSLTVQSTIWTGHQVLVWGSSAAPGTPNVLLSFDPSRWRWKTLAMPPMTPRSGPEVAWSGTSLIVFGGQSGAEALFDGAR